MKTAAVQIDKHAFYLEDERGHRKPMSEGLWGGVPGEFVPWRIRKWKREAREAYEILSELPPNFVFELM